MSRDEVGPVRLMYTKLLSERRQGGKLTASHDIETLHDNAG